MKDFKNKVVVITGAGSGMGRAYAIEFGKLGSKLALNDYDKKALNETVRMLKELGIETVYSKAFDVSNKKDMYLFSDEVKQQFGNAHVMLNNAGIEGSTVPAYHSTEEDYERIMQVNFMGVVHGSKAFLPQMVENGEGALVNISSIFGLIGTPNNSDYCASKFAVRGFTEALMAEFHDSPVSIHCVHPGGIATNIARKERGQGFSQKYLTTPPEKIAKYVIKSIKVGRPKIVYGNDSFKVWLASNLVPKRILKAAIWKEFKELMIEGEYDAFLKRK